MVLLIVESKEKEKKEEEERGRKGGRERGRESYRQQISSCQRLGMVRMGKNG